MRYPEQSAVMQKVLDMGSCGICVVMESERISMKNRRFRTLQKFRRGIKLKSGMTLAIEPMINIGTPDVLW